MYGLLCTTTYKRLISALLVWIVLLAQWGAAGHVLQHVAAVAGSSHDKGIAAWGSERATSGGQHAKPSDTSAAVHTACVWCLVAAQVLGSVVLGSTPHFPVLALLPLFKSSALTGLTHLERFTAYWSRAPPFAKLM